MATDIVQYPKYKYHATEPAKVVESADEDSALGDGWVDAPVEASAAPDELDELNRKDLAELGNLKYGLSLKGSQSKEALLVAIKEAQDKAAQ